MSALHYCQTCGVAFAPAPFGTGATCSSACRVALDTLRLAEAAGLPSTADPAALASPVRHGPLGATLTVIVRGGDDALYTPALGAVMHGVMVALTRTPHAQRPPFAAWPDPRHRCWRLLLPPGDALQQLAERRLHVPVGSRTREVDVGPAHVLVAPCPRGVGPHRVALVAETPVLIRSVDAGRKTRHTSPRPTPTGLASALAVTLAGRLGLGTFDARTIPLTLRADATSAADVNLRSRDRTLGGTGHFCGWTGRVELETSAMGAWLFECAAALGVGGRVAYGFGRVRVHAERIAS